MWRIRLSRAALLHGLVSIIIPLSSFVFAVEPVRGQAEGNAATGAPARSFGGSSARTSSRAVTVTRGGTSSSPRSTSVGTVRPSSIVNPRTAAPINGTNVANRVPAASRMGDAAPGVITRGYGAGDRTPGVITRGFGGNDGAPGIITRGYGAANAAPAGAITRGFAASNGYGGVGVNPAAGAAVNPAAGTAVNPAYGWDRGPAVVGPTGPDRNEPAIENSEWYRRYNERYRNAYSTDQSSGYNWTYNPVFLDSSGPLYYNNYQNYWLGFDPMQGPAQNGGGVNAPAEVAPAEPREPVERAEAPAQDRQAERKRAVARISPEKLHELMKEGLALFEAGKYSDAASKFLRVTLADRQNVDATLAYAAARFATGDYQISGLAVRRAVRRMPNVVNSAFDIRARYSNLRDFENHLARLEQYLRDHEDDEDAWVVLGFVRHFSGQRDLAAETFDRVRGVPGADVEVAEIFLAAKTEPAQTQPAGALPVVPAGGPPVLPAALADAEQLISVEVAE